MYLIDFKREFYSFHNTACSIHKPEVQFQTAGFIRSVTGNWVRQCGEITTAVFRAKEARKGGYD